MFASRILQFVLPKLLFSPHSSLELPPPFAVIWPQENTCPGASINAHQHNQIVNFIWNIADDCLRDIYTRGKYRDVILPMTVIRRLDAVLEDSKDAVLAMKKMLDEAKILKNICFALSIFSVDYIYTVTG